MRQSPPKGECTYRGSFDEVAEVEDLRSKRQLVPDYTAEGYLLLTKCAVAASSMRRYAGEGAIRFVTLDEMYAHRRAHRPLLADGRMMPEARPCTRAWPGLMGLWHQRWRRCSTPQSR